MSNGETPVNTARLLRTFHFEIKALPDKLKCAECKFVLKDSYQLSCGCRFCRTCIADVISRGGQCCPGGLQECGTTPLSTAVPDYRANKSILKLTAKCPHEGCPYECPLTDMESHVHACLSKNIDCPFRKLGCAQGALPGKEMSGHLLQESCSHSEILIGTVTKISRDMEMLKRELLMKDEQGRHLENEMKSIKDENKFIKDENKAINDVNKLIKIDIKAVKDENKSIKDEIKTIKIENKSIKDENKLMKNENKSIKIENESIKREKEVLSDRVRQISEKLDSEINERCQSDERDSARIRAVAGAVASNRNALGTEMEPVRGEIRSIRDQSDCMKRKIESIQLAMGLEQLDDWLIEEDLTKTEWWGWDNIKTCGKFRRTTPHYAYELGLCNLITKGVFEIYLLIWPSSMDSLLKWPFRGAVTVTVAHRDWHEACCRQTLQCEIDRPTDNQYRCSDYFKFPHAALREAGVDLKRGVRVSCSIRASTAVSPRVTLSPVLYD